MTRGEFVSSVINAIQAVNKDDRVSRRYVYHIANRMAKSLIALGIENKTLKNDRTVFTVINCFELEKIDTIKCPVVEFKTCKVLMKSVNKLPELISNKYGEVVDSVSTLDGEILFSYSNPKTYLRDRKRTNSNLSSKFYIQDGYLYIPNIDVEAVNIVVASLEVESEDTLSACSECDDCKSFWDYEFNIPDSLYLVLRQAVLAEMGFMKQVIPDENPNLDVHQKTATIR